MLVSCPGSVGLCRCSVRSQQAVVWLWEDTAPWPAGWAEGTLLWSSESARAAVALLVRLT